MPVNLDLGRPYTRLELAAEFGIERIGTSREGLVYLDDQDAAILFVTLDKGNAADGLNYNDWFEGNVFHWDSQTTQHFGTPRIQDLVIGRLEPHLLVRIHQRVEGETQPFIYAGPLEYLAAVPGTANPVHLTWIVSDYQEQPNDELQDVYEWRPEDAGHHANVPPVGDLEIPPRGQGRQADPLVRKAVEDRAMDVATNWYVGEGYEVENTAATHPYDLVCRRDDETIRVEVKGSIGAAATVIVTRNEVRSARLDGVPTDLFVLSGVLLELVDGIPRGHGGNMRRITPWVPADDALDPISFDYTLPPLM